MREPQIEIFHTINPDSPYKPTTAINPALIDDKTWRYLKEVQDRVKRYRLAHAPIHDMAGKLFDYKIHLFDEMNYGSGGWCRYWTKEIAIKAYNEKYIKDTLSHELSHAIQGELEYFVKEPDLLSAKVFCEQQAETISYYLSRILYPNDEVKPENFSSYMEIGSIAWLRDWYSRWDVQDDLLITTEREIPIETTKRIYLLNGTDETGTKTMHSMRSTNE